MLQKRRVITCNEYRDDTRLYYKHMFTFDKRVNGRKWSEKETLKHPALKSIIKRINTVRDFLRARVSYIAHRM